MTYQFLEYNTHDSLAVIKLNRPDKLNALNETLLKELKTILDLLARDDSCRCVLLTGNGRGFCTGADISVVNTDKDRGKRAGQGEASYQSLVQYFNPIIQCIYDMEKPVIAGVNGLAVGYGVSLALACDLVFAANSASFTQVFVPQLGLVPDGGATWMLPRLVGHARAMGMILTGQPIGAQQAKEWGMIWDCVADDQLQDTVFKLAYKLSQGPSMGISSMKLAMRHSDSNSLEKQLRLEAYLQKTCSASEDFAEGCLAFIEKRNPNFVGK